MLNRQEIVDALSAMIRSSSEAGCLLSETELREELCRRQLIASVPEDREELSAVLATAIGEEDDLQQLASAKSGRCFYSSRFMTGTYASILLGKGDDRLSLIAEVVRQNSASYPRPVPRDAFTHPPFDLTSRELSEILSRMAHEEGYEDIQSTTTSASTVFLYSTLHLEPGYASMLAEWLDVGQAGNP